MRRSPGHRLFREVKLAGRHSPIPSRCPLPLSGLLYGDSSLSSSCLPGFLQLCVVRDRGLTLVRPKCPRPQIPGQQPSPSGSSCWHQAFKRRTLLPAVQHSQTSLPTAMLTTQLSLETAVGLFPRPMESQSPSFICGIQTLRMIVVQTSGPDMPTALVLGQHLPAA